MKLNYLIAYVAILPLTACNMNTSYYSYQEDYPIGMYSYEMPVPPVHYHPHSYANPQSIFNRLRIWIIPYYIVVSFF